MNSLLEGMEVNAKASVRNVAVVTRIIIITSVVAFVGTIRRGMILQFDAIVVVVIVVVMVSNVLFMCV